MKSMDLLRGGRYTPQALSSGHSSFKGLRLPRGADAALARRAARLRLAPAAVAEVSASDIEARGERERTA